MEWKYAGIRESANRGLGGMVGTLYIDPFVDAEGVNQCRRLLHEYPGLVARVGYTGKTCGLTNHES